MTHSWRDVYADTAERILAAAPAARPILAGFNVCVDSVHTLDGSHLDAMLTAAEDTGHPAADLSRTVLDRIAHGRGGEIFVPWPDGPEWAGGLLGEPRARQVGGTAPQAAWTLAEAGARGVVALADRSSEQLSVLHPAIGVCDGDGVAAAGSVRGTGAPAKPAHYILEFGAGTRWRGGVVPRSSRIILRFAEDGIERDDDFAAVAPVAKAGAGLVSGLNGVPAADAGSRAWVRDVVRRWRDDGLGLIHLELAEYNSRDDLVAVCEEYGGTARSLGLSWSELRTLVGGDGEPSAGAVSLAERFGFDRVCVHADTWSMSVHRGDPETERKALLAGNLLAATRARLGAPSADLALDPGATFDEERPSSGAGADAWRVECLPSPYLSSPASTVGLGDSFVAGCLLALSGQQHEG